MNQIFIFLLPFLLQIVSCVDFAVVKFNVGPGDVEGWLQLYQSKSGEPTLIVGRVWGLKPNRRFGFHIHNTGDIANGCESVGPHYNPGKNDHGGPTSSERHLGDLGNLQSDFSGAATINIVDKMVTLTGKNSVMGRAIVVHEGEDDLGRGDDEESKKTGNSGKRIKCGIIGKSARSKNKMFYAPVSLYPFYGHFHNSFHHGWHSGLY